MCFLPWCLLGKSPEWIGARVCVLARIVCRPAGFLPPPLYLGRLKLVGNASAHKLCQRPIVRLCSSKGKLEFQRKLCKDRGWYILPYTRVRWAPGSWEELRLCFVWCSLCSPEQAFLLMIRKTFQGCVPNKHVLFGAGTDCSCEPGHTWVVATGVKIWPMENCRQKHWGCKIKNFVVWHLMVPTAIPTIQMLY